MDKIRTALEGASAYLTANPDEARYTDSAAVATLREGLRVSVTGPAGEAVATDMTPSVGGSGSAPSAGWLFRAAQASCVATLIAMRAAMLGIRLESLEVTVDSESDDRGILGLDPDVPAGPLSGRVRVRVAAAAELSALDRIARWGVDHCPVVDGLRRAIPVALEIDSVAVPRQGRGT